MVKTQVRQFLKAFRDVDTFHEAFGQLDENTQSMVQSFIDGKSSEDVTHKSGFALPPSPGKRSVTLFNLQADLPMIVTMVIMVRCFG